MSGEYLGFPEPLSDTVAIQHPGFSNTVFVQGKTLHTSKEQYHRAWQNNFLGGDL